MGKKGTRQPDRRKMPAKQAVERVIHRLHRAGYEALLAGGCVRDMLLGRKPIDYDVATGARPQEVTKLFPRTLTVGAQFGVVIVLMGGRQIEVATFRGDADYKDGRHPKSVHFTDARHDGRRRDFTINGMFYDITKRQVIDYVGGQRDLKKQVIRAIGNPEERFAEDHLRMLRAIRFSCRLQFSIEKETFSAIRSHAAKIHRISAERIAGELERILVDPNRQWGVQQARASGLLREIFPRLTEKQLNFGIRVLAEFPKRVNFGLALAGLLAGCDSRQGGQVCRSLKSSNAVRAHVQWLLGRGDEFLDAVPMSTGLLKKWMAEPLFESMLLWLRGVLRGRGESESSLRRVRRQIRQLGDEVIAPERLLDGHELIRLGAAPGPMVGQLAEELYLAQLENEVQTTKQAGEWVKKWLSKKAGMDDES